MNKIFIICFIVSTIVSLSPMIANPTEMQDPDSIGKAVRDFLGCPGGDNKCFSGSFSYKGVEFEGTWYLK